MNYKSVAVPVQAEQFNENSFYEKDYVMKEYIEVYESPNATCDTHQVGYKLKSKYGSTEVPIGSWIVVFPNGEVHVVLDERFKQRFEEVESFTPEEVKNAISMAKTLSAIGDCV